MRIKSVSTNEYLAGIEDSMGFLKIATLVAQPDNEATVWFCEKNGSLYSFRNGRQRNGSLTTAFLRSGMHPLDPTVAVGEPTTTFRPFLWEVAFYYEAPEESHEGGFEFHEATEERYVDGLELNEAIKESDEDVYSSSSTLVHDTSLSL